MNSNKLPLVSVIIPAYNHQDYIEEAICSVLEQDYSNLEVIVVDDGSTDETPNIVEKVLNKSRKPNKYIKQRNQGAHVALNEGIRLAKGEFISILNSDDFYQDGRITKFVITAFQTKADFLFSKVRHIGEKGEILPLSFPMVSIYHNALEEKEWFPTKSFELLRYNYSISTGNFFFSRRLYEILGGFNNYKLCHDWDFILRALIYDEPFFVDETLMSYRVHGQNTIITEAENNIREIETSRIISNYVEMAQTPQNDLAPCWKNWGRYWSYFTKKYMSYAFHMKSQFFSEFLTAKLF